MRPRRFANGALNQITVKDLHVGAMNRVASNVAVT